MVLARLCKALPVVAALVGNSCCAGTSLQSEPNAAANQDADELLSSFVRENHGTGRRHTTDASVIIKKRSSFASSPSLPLASVPAVSSTRKAAVKSKEVLNTKPREKNLIESEKKIAHKHGKTENDQKKSSGAHKKVVHEKATNKKISTKAIQKNSSPGGSKKGTSNGYDENNDGERGRGKKAVKPYKERIGKKQRAVPTHKRGKKGAGKRKKAPSKPTPAPSEASIAITAFPLVAFDDGGHALVNVRETNLGRLVATAILSASPPPIDIAIINGGSIRANIPGPSITRSDIAGALPFNNKLIIRRLTATQLLAAMENSVSKLPSGDGRFGLMAGVEMEYSVGPPGLEGMEEVLTPSRVMSLRLATNSGTRTRRRTQASTIVEDAMLTVAPTETFVVATNEFLGRDGGDGYTSLAAGALLATTDVTTREALEQYLLAVGTININDPPDEPAVFPRVMPLPSVVPSGIPSSSASPSISAEPSASSMPSTSQAPSGTPVKAILEVQFDTWPQETRIVVINTGTYLAVLNLHGSNENKNELVSMEVGLVLGVEYELVVTDTYGDGIVSGHVRIYTAEGGSVLGLAFINGDNFGSTARVLFTARNPTSSPTFSIAPSLAPSASAIPSASAVPSTAPTLSSMPSASQAPSVTFENFYLEIKYDEYPWETQVVLVDDTSSATVIDLPFNHTNSSEVLTRKVDLVIGNRYQLVVGDSYGDGIINGHVKIVADWVDGAVDLAVIDGLSFKSRTSVFFTVAKPTETACENFPNGTTIFLNNNICFESASGRELNHCEDFSTSSRSSVETCGDVLNSSSLCNGHFESLLNGFSIRAFGSPGVNVATVPLDHAGTRYHLVGTLDHVGSYHLVGGLFSALFLDYTTDVTVASFLLWCPFVPCSYASVSVLDTFGSTLASTGNTISASAQSSVHIGIVANTTIGSIIVTDPTLGSEMISELCFEP